MKRPISIGVLVLTSAMTAAHASPALARGTGMAAALLNALSNGGVTVDQLVAATAASCKCAPPKAAALAAAAALPSVDVGSATGDPGQQVTFAVTLSTAGASVAAVGADIAFDSINTPVAATGTGEPDCMVNAGIDKEATAFFFQPPGCAGSACTAVRAIVISFTNLAEIPDGSVLYTCNVDISPGAAAGSYPLTISNVQMVTPDIPPQLIDSTGTDGQIVVSGPPPTPTASPTPTPVPIGPTNKDQCKGGGWQSFTSPRSFKNQGDCIQFVNTGK